jgi:hypothetical protein
MGEDPPSVALPVRRAGACERLSIDVAWWEHVDNCGARWGRPLPKEQPVTGRAERGSHQEDGPVHGVAGLCRQHRGGLSPPPQGIESQSPDEFTTLPAFRNGWDLQE